MFTVDTVLKVALLLSPIAYKFNMPVRVLDISMFYTFVFALTVASFFDIPVRKVDLRPLGSLIFVIIASMFANDYNLTIVTSGVNLFFGILAVKIICEYVIDTDELTNYMIIAGALNIVYFSVQTLGWSPIIENLDGEPGGLMANAPRLGMYLAIIMPFVYKRSKAAFFLFMNTGFVIGEIGTFVVGLLVLFIHSKSWKMRAFVITIVAAGAYLLHGYVYTRLITRLTVWKPVVEAIFTRPLEGHGLGSFSLLSAEIVKHEWVAETAFSSALQFIFELGFLFGLAWLAYFIWHYRGEFRRTNAAGLLSIGVVSLWEYPFQVERLWITIAAIVAFFIINTKPKEFKGAIA